MYARHSVSQQCGGILLDHYTYVQSTEIMEHSINNKGNGTVGGYCCPGNKVLPHVTAMEPLGVGIILGIVAMVPVVLPQP